MCRLWVGWNFHLTSIWLVGSKLLDPTFWTESIKLYWVSSWTEKSQKNRWGSTAGRRKWKHCCKLTCTFQQTPQILHTNVTMQPTTRMLAACWKKLMRLFLIINTKVPDEPPTITLDPTWKINALWSGFSSNLAPWLAGLVFGLKLLWRQKLSLSEGVSKPGKVRYIMQHHIQKNTNWTLDTTDILTMNSWYWTHIFYAIGNNL